jgi:hypothetical protein
MAGLSFLKHYTVAGAINCDMLQELTNQFLCYSQLINGPRKYSIILFLLNKLDAMRSVIFQVAVRPFCESCIRAFLVRPGTEPGTPQLWLMN